MKRLLLGLALMIAQSRPASLPAGRLFCLRCGGEIERASIAWLLCSDPHPQLHVKDCHANRHAGCLGEITNLHEELEVAPMKRAPVKIAADSKEILLVACAPDDLAARVEARQRGERPSDAQGQRVRAGADAHLFLLASAFDPRVVVRAGIYGPDKAVIVTLSRRAPAASAPAPPRDAPSGFDVHLGSLARGDYAVTVLDSDEIASRPASAPAPANAPGTIPPGLRASLRLRVE